MFMKEIRKILASIKRADETFNLINHGDKIVIGLSGGKDSMVLTYALSLYQKFAQKDFTIQPIILDLGFDGFNAERLAEWVASIGLTLMVEPAKEVYPILQIQMEKGGLEHLPCSICSRMKKAAINKAANHLGFSKVAFAHHADDAVETLFLNQIYGGRIATFAPKMHLERANITFIRPLIFAEEASIIRCAKELELPVIPSPCPADKHTTREEIKDLLNQIYTTYPEAKTNFLGMLTNYEKADVWFDEIAYSIPGTNLYVKPAYSAEDKTKVMYIRMKVFVEEQKIAIDDEIEKDEFSGHYFLLMQDDNIIGTIRYTGSGSHYHLGRFAILKEYRNLGYGKLLFRFMENYLRERHRPITIELHAQAYLKDYYGSLGYEVIGDIFYEAGIPHYLMKKELA